MITIDRLEKASERILGSKIHYAFFGYKNTGDTYLDELKKEEIKQKVMNQRKLLIRLANLLYNPKRLLKNIIDNPSIKIFFITINYTSNLNKLMEFYENTIRFLQYSINELSLFNNEYYTKKDNHFHNHILFFTKSKKTYKSTLIQKIYKLSNKYIYDRKYIDIKVLDRDNTNFIKNFNNKINYIIGKKLNNIFIKDDKLLCIKKEIPYYSIVGNNNTLKEQMKTYIKHLIEKNK